MAPSLPNGGRDPEKAIDILVGPSSGSDDEDRVEDGWADGNGHERTSQEADRLLLGASPSYPPTPTSPGLVVGVGAKPTPGLTKALVVQTLPSLLFSLVGGILSGVVLEHMQEWPVFIRVEELFILVPIVMNLKGNLEMNLAARMSTSANVGDLDIPSTRRALVVGNLYLLQVQALIVSFFASLISFVLGMLSRNDLPSLSRLHNLPISSSKTGWRPGLRGSYYECVMVLCAGMLAASLSSAILGSFMCALILVCLRADINPDNVSTPIAASLGDLLTLVLLGYVSAGLIRVMSTLVSTLILVALVLSVAVYVRLTLRNAYVRRLLSTGWTPLLIAMAISAATGLVLERFVNAYQGFGLLALVVMMVPGNAGAIFVSRIATALHAGRREPRMAVAVSLFGITMFTLASFLLFVWLAGEARLDIWLALGTLVAGAVNTLFALGLAVVICDQLWKRHYDPDVCALPLLSSLTDVSGQLLVVLAYLFANSLTHQSYSAVTESTASTVAS